MNTIGDRIRSVWNRIKAGPAITRAHFTMADDEQPAFQDDQHYFQVIVNEMFLAKQREWFVNYAPVAFVAATYQYGRTKGETAPAIIGPSMFQEYRQEVPQGAIIRNAPVTGLHPYRGGPFTLTIVFSKVEQSNNVDKVLTVLEDFAGIANPVKPAIPFVSYLKVAGDVVDGFRTLMNLPEAAPLMAHRLTINPTVNQPFEPTHLVLIDADESTVDRDAFTIHTDGPYARLYHNGAPYRENDFLLLQIAQGTRRDDAETLPFYPLWEKALQQAMQSGNGNEEMWKQAKAHYNSLKYEMRFSPDLTRPDYDRLRQTYLSELTAVRQEAVDEGLLGPRDEADAEALTPDERADMRAIEATLDALDAENL